MVGLLTLEKPDTAPNTVFFVVFLMGALINAVQIHFPSHCYMADRLA